MQPTDPADPDVGPTVLDSRSRPGAGGSTPGADDGRSPPRETRRSREALRRITALNETLHEVTRRLADVATPDGIEDALDRLARTSLYDGVAFLGTIDPWRPAATGADTGTLPPEADRDPLVWRNRTGVPAPLDPFAGVPDVGRGSWALLPVRSGGTAHGHLVLATDRSGAFGDRELAILERFGGTLGLVVDAVADRRLLRSDAVTELTIECSEGTLASIVRDVGCRLSFEGLVPAETVLVYVGASDGEAGRVVDAATGVDGVEAARAVDDGTVELSLTDGSALVALVRGGTNLRTVELRQSTPAAVEAVVEVAPGTDVRSLFDRVRDHAPGARLAAKRERTRPPSTDCAGSGTSGPSVDGLTDRQLETVEAAYRSGYFEWPRDRTGEEIAEAIGISAPTFHQHLRTAERSVLSTLFDAGPGPNRDRSIGRE